MDSDHRSACLRELGLVDWRARADGPLGGGARQQAPAVDTAGESELAPDQVTAEAAEVAVDVQTAPAPPASAAPTSPASPSGMGWDELEAWLTTRDHRGAQRPVFGVGARDADVLIVGEAPGAQEDAQGVPFVGRAGKLLDRMLFAIGCSRETNVYITNICKFRPPNNRDPNAEEVAADWPVLERQIELMDPTLVVAVGRVAAQTLLNSGDSLGKLRGRTHKYPQRDLDVLITYHPAFLLRSPQMKARAWADLKRIAARIGAGGRTA
ncbi:DNA polymerase [Salinisphaera orenii MK-B5]|uniref:Type-4 uracil-DNA glycosylase n=2 Tax=Salinisphaera orenii TaxID=856731 RepID=A0A423PPU5_9GAMM|nr:MULTISPECIES: uracil-DNA glycosylase [Salinisphaera]ROO27597.1 DNA polymerase [Salinisphaera orenii MK-B5]ROO37500.1 DNA polymerase [Salinisphaera halophila YIM 95161]